MCKSNGLYYKYTVDKLIVTEIRKDTAYKVNLKFF